MNRSNPYRSHNRSSFNSRRGASRPQSRRHSLRHEEESVSRANPYETNRFGSSQRRGQRFEPDQRRSYEEDLSRDRDGRRSYYEGSDDPAEGPRSSEPRRDNNRYSDNSNGNRYSQWNRPSYDSRDPRSFGSRYSPMEDDRWQDDLDLDHAYEYRVEDQEENERVHHRGPINRYDERSAQNRSRYSNSRRRRNDPYRS